MRTLMAAVLLIAIPALVHAQDASGLRRVRGLHVALIDTTSYEWQGRLLEVAKDALIVELDTGTRRFDLRDVKRVDAHGDKVWDGALKGAAFGAVVALIAPGGARHAGQAALAYGLLGVAMDALNSCNHTVYRAPAAQASVKVSW